MRLRIVLPKVNPKAIAVPTHCAYAGCSSRTFHFRQEVAKALHDTVYQEVPVHRYQCTNLWWIKERYRTMRGYKVPEHAVRVSRLLAWCGNFLNAEGEANLAGLLQ